MSTKVVRFKCDYCNKELKTENGMSKHEKEMCWHNPAHMSCFTCGLFVDEELIDEGFYNARLFMGLPKCEKGHDLLGQNYNGGDFEYDKPCRQIGCAYYEPRLEHPGEYAKFSTGSGGYRKVYLEASKDGGGM